MSPLIFFYLIAGLVLLVLGAEVLVRGAASLAAALRIPPLIIGLTVVAFGTSAPELAVSVGAAWNGSGDLAVGNVLGSNILNVLGILGLSAVLLPLLVSRQLVQREVPLMIGASLLALLLALDLEFSRLDGALLFSGILAYMLLQVVQSRRNPAEVSDHPAQLSRTRFSWIKDTLLILAGLGLLVTGAQWLVHGATDLARALGLSELVIGLTVIALGTSLPELATSLLAAFKGEREIAVGNIVGSNIFNLLAVLGLTALVSPAPLSVSPNALAFDFPVMVAVAVACLPIFFSGHRISRWEGLLFLAYYLAYTGYLLLFTTGRPLAKTFGDAMLYYALPLTLVTLLVITARAWRRQATWR
jgi:cation:H+ antiporter